MRIYNPFPLDAFLGIRPAYDDDGETSGILYVGRLVNQKGVDVLVHAYAKYATRPVGSVEPLVLVGDGPDRSDLEELVRTLGIERRVSFLGSLTGQDLLDVVRSAQIAVVPSVWEEPFGGVTTELMAAGKPLIVSERGAPAEIAADACLTFPNGDSAALADRLLQIGADPHLRRRLRQAGERRIRTFDEDILVDQYMELFESLV